jgi:TolB-like protein/tRNA A-37 threonylcarbamoyl transferase component Bud32/Tfp pilus assembly protein PilF
MELKPGDKLGAYEIVSLLGKGGMGEVWKARDPRLGRDVAIKVSAQQFTYRFEREARAIAALNHPNICQIHDIGPDYLVLEYIEGKPLRGPLPADECVGVALQIAAALEEAHAQGILHRDLKPGNIMVTTNGSAKLLDFGLAKLTADAEGTHTMAVMGTPAYMAPEQLQGKPADARSEIFSFGLVLYEMLSGRQAFAGDSAVVGDEPAPLDAPARLSAVVSRCLRKLPASRFQAMNEVHSALEQATAVATGDAPSVAVLPFVNISADKDNEYFSDGLAEEILNALTRFPDLKVTARTSAFSFRGKELDIRKIGEALGVRTVLEGSVRRAGNRIRVTVQLINIADGYHLWSERYDRELRDVFAMQDEIAAAIAGALQAKLTGKPAPARPHQPDLAAWEACLKGRHHFFKRSPQGFARAKEYFEKAIALDPQWADPHYGLGGVLYFLGALGLRPLSEMVPLARVEARKAVELLPSGPGAHSLLGVIAALHDYDWEEAGEHFGLAMASGSPPAEVRGAYALWYLMPLGRFEEAIAEGAKAIAQDPLSIRWRTAQAGVLLSAGRYDSALAEARAALELDDRNDRAHLVIAESYFFQGRPTEAREPAEEAFRLAPWDPAAAGFLAGLLMQSGEKERAEKMIATIRGMVPVAMIIYHLVCGEIDSAIDWYERDIELRQPSAAPLACSEFLKPLRDSPRWPKLARMMNLPGTVS